jgi:hypothetical protein
VVPNIPNASARPLAPEFKQKQGAFQWDRQVLFLKGKSPDRPNYFVFRDSTRGEGKLASYLNLNLLGRKTNLKTEGSRISVDTEWPVKLDLLFAQPPSTPALLEEDHAPQWAELKTAGSFAKGETPSRDWLTSAGTPWKTGEGVPAKEQHVFLRIPAAPDQGYFWVVYPRDEKEPTPLVKRLADGVLSVTHREGTDYVLLSSLPLKYEGDGVLLEGCAGAVRIAGDSVVLTLAGTGNGRVGYKGKILEGAAPFEKRLPLASLAAGVEKQSAPQSRVAMPTGEAGDEVAPGLRKKVEGSTIRYRVEAERPVLARTDNVQVEACHAAIEVNADSVRFIVPDGQYARLSVAGVGVRGLGPFDLTFTSNQIKGTVDGRLRSLVTTWPEKIVRPMYRMDDRLWYAGWADDPCIGKTPDRPQFSIAFGVQDGTHTVEIGEWQFPAMPPAPPTARIAL